VQIFWYPDNDTIIDLRQLGKDQDAGILADRVETDNVGLVSPML